MTSPIVTYLTDGSTKQFNIPFPYLRRTHVIATLAGASVPFDWIHDTRIECATPPPADSELVIRRRTPAEPIFVLQDNRPLPAKNFMELVLQAIYLAQEIEAGSGGASGGSGGGGGNIPPINFDPSAYLEKSGGTITGDLAVEGILSTASRLIINQAGFYSNGDIQGSIWEPWGSSWASAAINARIEARAATIAEAKVDAALNAFKHNPQFTGTLKCSGNIQAYSS